MSKSESILTIPSSKERKIIIRVYIRNILLYIKDPNTLKRIPPVSFIRFSDRRVFVLSSNFDVW